MRTVGFCSLSLLFTKPVSKSRKIGFPGRKSINHSVVYINSDGIYIDIDGIYINHSVVLSLYWNKTDFV